MLMNLFEVIRHSADSQKDSNEFVHLPKIKNKRLRDILSGIDFVQS